MPDDQRNAFLNDRTACILSKDIADALKLHIGDRVVLVGDIYPVTLDMKIVGIFKDPDATSSLFFNWEYLRDLLPVGASQQH